MALTTFLMTVSMVAIASAGFPGWAENNNPFPGYPSPMVSSLRFGPIASPPSIPGIPTFQNFPFFQFPVFPTIPTFPTMPDIANVVPPPGGSFTGVMINSKSESKRNEDGTYVKKGVATIVTNTDGEVTVKKIEHPSSDKPTNSPPSFDSDDLKIKPSKLNQFKNFNFKNFEGSNFGFRHTVPLHFEPIDPVKIENYVPGPDETFIGHASRSSSFCSNINGVVNQGGSETIVDNDNGHVNKKDTAYRSDGTQP